MNAIRLPIWVLLAALVWAAGCVAPKHHPDPLYGWKRSWSQNPSKFDKAIVDDYQEYIQKLPQKERILAIESNISFFENSTGQHAVRISIPVEGLIGDIWWNHILVYDTNDRRIRTIKHKGGRSLS